MLFLWLVPYAMSKVAGLQFTIYPSSAFQQPLEELSGKRLTWAFLGYSYWFHVLLGFLELIPAIMLVFRRTYLLGAVILLPVMLNVVLINFAMDLWPATKVISLIMLTFNLLIILLEHKKIVSAYRAIMQRTLARRYKGIEIIVNVLLIAGWCWFFMKDYIEYKQEQSALMGNWLDRNPAEWKLTYKTDSKGLELPCKSKKIFFSLNNCYTETLEGKTSDIMSYSLDKKDTTLTISTEYNVWLRSYKYELLGDSLLKLRPIGYKDSTVEVYAKRIMNKHNM